MGNKDNHEQPVDEQLETQDAATEKDVKPEKTKKFKDAKKKKSGKKAGLSKKLEEAQAETAELKDKYLRLLAEFENFKKRTFREKIETMKSAAQDTMSAILPVLDDFDRAKKNADDDNTTEQFSEGVELVYNKLHAKLSQQGLTAMESTGEAFDPELHEAITEIPAPSEELKGKVVDTIEKGYLLKDKIIRHAKVVVGK